MGLTNAQMHMVQRVSAYQRWTPQQKREEALKAYRVRYLRAAGDGQVPKPRIRQVRYGRGRHLYVLVMRKHYLAAESWGNLLRKLIFGGWRRVATCQGPAKRAFR